MTNTNVAVPTRLISRGGIEFTVNYETACNFSVYRTLPGEVKVYDRASWEQDPARRTMEIPVEIVDESMTNRFFSASSDASRKAGTITTCTRCLTPADYAKYGLELQS